MLYRVLSAIVIAPRRMTLPSGVSVTTNGQLREGAKDVPAVRVVPLAKASAGR